MSPDPNKKLAEYVSAATRLPLVAVPLFLVVGVAAGGVRGVLWALLSLFLTSGLSLAYLAYMTKSGKVRDPRRISQSERARPLWVVAGLHVGAFLLVTLLGAPEPLLAILLSYALATSLFALLTPYVKLSLHSAGVSGATVCLAYVFGGWGALAALLLPPVWWARQTLNRHTSLELMLGVLAGGGGTWLAFELIHRL
ncbi:hypothetical protein BH23ACT11_BH23ACT11_21840 [soil metagenome]